MGKKHSDKSTQNDEPQLSTAPSSNLPKHLAETAWKVAIPFLVFALAGIKLDERYDSSPVFSLIGIGLALVSVTVIVYRFVETNYPGTFRSKSDE